jgi:hypothetical protein
VTVLERQRPDDSRGVVVGREVHLLEGDRRVSQVRLGEQQHRPPDLNLVPRPQRIGRDRLAVDEGAVGTPGVDDAPFAVGLRQNRVTAGDLGVEDADFVLHPATQAHRGLGDFEPPSLIDPLNDE